MYPNPSNVANITSFDSKHFPATNFYKFGNRRVPNVLNWANVPTTPLLTSIFTSLFLYSNPSFSLLLQYLCKVQAFSRKMIYVFFPCFFSRLCFIQLFQKYCVEMKYDIYFDLQSCTNLLKFVNRRTRR